MLISNTTDSLITSVPNTALHMLHLVLLTSTIVRMLGNEKFAEIPVSNLSKHMDDRSIYRV